MKGVLWNRCSWKIGKYIQKYVCEKHSSFSKIAEDMQFTKNELLHNYFY